MDNYAPLDRHQVDRLENILTQKYEIDGVRYPQLSVAPADIISRLKVKIISKMEGVELESIRNFQLLQGVH